MLFDLSVFVVVVGFVEMCDVVYVGDVLLLCVGLV